MITKKQTAIGFHHSIWVRAEFTALHCWPDAPKKVAFLRAWHRHIFRVKMLLDVKHNNRDLEFFIVQEDLKKVLKKWEGKKVMKSCEMFAEDVIKQLRPKYPSLRSVEVSEDGENGSITTVYDDCCDTVGIYSR